MSENFEKSEMRNRIKTGLLICSVVYAVFEGSVSIATPQLVELMGQATDLQEETVAYIRCQENGVKINVFKGFR